MALVKFQELRNSLYELLEAATQEDDNGGGNNIQAHQALGVQLTKAVQRDGVNIIQLQNIRAIGRVTGATVRALRELDALEVGYVEAGMAQARPLIAHQAQVEEVEDTVTTCEAPETALTVESALSWLCEHLVGAGMGVQDVVKVVRYGAAVAAMGLHNNNVKAASKALGIQPSYLHVLKRRPEGLLDGE